MLDNCKEIQENVNSMTVDEVCERVAEALHCLTSLIPRKDGSLVPKWSELTDTDRNLATRAVRILWQTYNDMQSLITPSYCHEFWKAGKTYEGWTCGEVYDQEAKTHPCLIPYEELPDSEKMKDILWCNMIKSIDPILACRIPKLDNIGGE